MTPEHREEMLNLAQKLEFSGKVWTANVLRGVLLEADKVPDLEKTIASLLSGGGDQ